MEDRVRSWLSQSYTQVHVAALYEYVGMIRPAEYVVQVYDELEKRAIVPSMTGAAALRDSEAGSDCTRSDINVQARTPGHTPDGCSSSEGRLSE